MNERGGNTIMLGRLIIIFITVPLLDLLLLLRVGQAINFWPTVSIVILTGILGAALAKRQGLKTLAAINTELAAGRMPAAELADGVLILLAGAVLITPGFLTDLFGFALLFPPMRRFIQRRLTRYFQSRTTITMADDFQTPRPMKYVKNESEQN